MASNSPIIVWFRQDLRIEDNEALNMAIKAGQPIIPLYIMDDTTQAWKMGSTSLWWLEKSLISLAVEFQKLGLNLIIRKGKPLRVLTELIKEVNANKLFYNRCYEPANLKDDSYIKAEFASQNFQVFDFCGNVLFEPWEIRTLQEKPFKVFTPFYNACMKKQIKEIQVLPKLPIPSFEKKIHSEQIELPKDHQDLSHYWKPGSVFGKKVLKQFLKDQINEYKETRDRPDLNGVSHLSPYLHFGEISPAMILHEIKTSYSFENEGIQCFIKQIFWREFGVHLLYHFPKTTNSPFQEKYSDFPWKNDPVKLKQWQLGMTGYPLVDAGMRQLIATGWMHNRVRMVVGSFLVKDLNIPWLQGALWFYEKLVDADLANNTLGWQWVAGCGADAAPYFRIFNPTTQSEKFDPLGIYIRKWVPELDRLDNKWIHKPFMAPRMVLEMAGVELGKTYPNPIVDHDIARKEALEALKSIRNY